MKQLAATCAFALAILGAAHTASAGGYVSAGIGADASLTGDMAANFTTDTPDAASGRIAIGQRVGRLAVEVQLYGADVKSTTNLGGRDDYSTMTFGVAAKYYIPVSGGLEAYGKAGLDKTYLVSDSDTMAAGYSGRGYNFGGGLEYGFSTGILASASIWLDFTHQQFELREQGIKDLNGGAQLLTLGVSVGF